jgi:transcriptional regulator with XRE-family HTH domain
LRESVKLSQNKIGELYGAKQATVNRYEHENAEATYRVLLWYADYFDVSIDYIFGRTDKPQGKDKITLDKSVEFEYNKYDICSCILRLSYE